MRISRRLQFAALIAIAALAFSACGGGTDEPESDAQGTPAAEETQADVSPADATSTPGDRDDDGPCSLLTEEEGNQFLGVAATSVEESTTGPFVACQWINDASLPIQLLQVGTFGFEVDSEFFRETASASGSSNLEEVSGIGDEAFWDGSQLFIRQGQLMLSIIPSRDGGKEQAIAAAELVVPRLD